MGSHYFDRSPTAASSPRQVNLALPDVALTFTTDRAVFSADRIDPGTKLLLQVAPMPDAGHVVADVGCGYGPIAVTVATRQPECTVWAVDLNERARTLCVDNARAARCRSVTVGAPEDVPSDLIVDRIYSNPPIKIGKAPLHELLGGWLGRLRPGTGRAYLVVHKHLGSDSLARWLVEQGWPTERLVSRQGYRVLGVGPSTVTT